MVTLLGCPRALAPCFKVLPRSAAPASLCAQPHPRVGRFGGPRGQARPTQRLRVVAMSSFPTPAERNRRLARRLKEAVAAAGGPPSTYGDIKQLAADFRAGRVNAQELCSAFFAILGHSTETEELYVEMAELLPTPQLYLDLVDAMHSTLAAQQQRQQQEHQKQQQLVVEKQKAQQQGQLGQQDLRQQQVGQRQQQKQKQQLQEPWGIGSRSPAGPAARWAATSPVAGSSQQSGGQDQKGDSTTAAESLAAGLLCTNSQSSRPAKPLPVAKRARSSAPAVGSVVNATDSQPGHSGILVWLRQDLRLHDNPTLCAAAADAQAQGGAVTFVFVHSPEEDGDDPATGTSWRPGAASLVWLHGALGCMDSDLQARYGPGAGILYRRGPYAAALRETAAAVGAGAVYFSRRYEPAMQATDAAVRAELESSGLAVHSFGGFLLREPHEVRVDMGKWAGHFGTLMPFYRACEALGPLTAPLPPPASLPVADRSPQERLGDPTTLDDLGLARMPTRPDGTVIDWAAPIRAAWDFSEQGAINALNRFISTGLARYESDRGYADGRCVSRLSPYLTFGQISPRYMMHRLKIANCKQVSKTFWRRLVWRDLAYWQLHHWPRMAAQPIRPHYAAQEWQHSPEALWAWQRGATGFPLVDAGMRELWATGWMQQNARMAVACLLTEYLGIHWVEGARWFHDTLVDADLAINSMMWQNAGKSGLDQWNFTVTPFSKSQDPSGTYIRRWVPELSRMPSQYVHEPWKAPPGVLAAAGVVLGETYPHRITDRDMQPASEIPWEELALQELRARTTAAIRAARLAGGPVCMDSQGYDLITLPQGSTVAHDGQRMRVFTVPDIRSGDSATGAGRGRGGATRQSSSRSSSSRGGRGGGGRRVDERQRTMLEFVARTGQ